MNKRVERCEACSVVANGGAVHTIYTVKTSLVHGWRGNFCFACLLIWINDTPQIQRYSRVTITNNPLV